MSDKQKQIIKRERWTPNFQIKFPEDWGLALEEGIRDSIPSELLEIYTRFYKLGYIGSNGSQCVLMSSLLRRILRLHGFQTTTKQVILYYEHEEKQKYMTIGGHMFDTKPNEIDVHIVTIVDDKWLLDFAAMPISDTFGHVYPIAFIARSNIWTDEWQNFGNLHGKATWVRSHPVHPMIKHFKFENHDLEKQLTKQYFRQYEF